MQLSIYLDVQGYETKPEDFFPFTTPRSLSAIPGVVRYRIDVEIPDPAKPDKIIKAKAVEERGKG